ncbi:hypothetical protein L915_15694, partial [Phytophthora nicotianae]
QEKVGLDYVSRVIFHQPSGTPRRGKFGLGLKRLSGPGL